MAETGQAPSTKTWDGAALPKATSRVRKFEAAWNASRKKRRPNPRAFLPDDPQEIPAALLALLTTEIGLRWQDDDRVNVEQYRKDYPELGDDALVALIYEEFCLREEAGDAPVPVEYDERFPELVGRLRRVFTIHNLVGTASLPSLRDRSVPEVAFPESGQTTGGFYLREELGRGAFARVFLAEERQLADRPVALKISRMGSKEPQTLARLQHTNIVPLHSYRTDPSTGFHLLCMPYFGRVTLDRLLADDAVKKACTGADLLEVLDRLDPQARRDAVSTRSTFASLPFARAIALWGASMAEALAHAHERGVLHRDIKPSNVLVTADGLPMLLDFNLSKVPKAEIDEQAKGGTVAYMSPEHLEALAENNDDSVDERGDIYSLGVLLFEVLTGSRPFAMPKGATSMSEALNLAAEIRRRGVPSIRESHPEIPVALESVVRKCLAADPNRRYVDASALACDLQAVADDSALVHAKEPFVSRSVRFARRRRWPLALIGLMGIAWLFLANAVIRAREDQTHEVALLERWIEEGESFAKQGQFDRAHATFVLAAQLATKDRDFAEQPIKVLFRDRALEQLRLVNLTIDAQKQAEAFLNEADEVRGQFGRVSNSAILAPKIDRMLAPYLNSTAGPQTKQLDVKGRERLKRVLEEMLFSRAILASGQGGDARLSSKLIALGLGLSQDRAPWLALAAWSTDPSKIVKMSESHDVRDATSHLLMGILSEAQGQFSEASKWYKQAERLDPSLPGLPIALARTIAREAR